MSNKTKEEKLQILHNRLDEINEKQAQARNNKKNIEVREEDFSKNIPTSNKKNNKLKTYLIRVFIIVGVFLILKNINLNSIDFKGFLSEKEDVKYLNSPETLLFEKSKIFYGSYQTLPNIRKQNFAILVEGQTDFLRLVEQGFDNVLATSGTAFSSKHAIALKKYTNRVILCYDSDGLCV